MFFGNSSIKLFSKGSSPKLLFNKIFLSPFIISLNVVVKSGLKSLNSIDKVKDQWILLKSNRVFVSSVSKISIELIDLTLIICLKAFWFVYDT